MPKTRSSKLDRDSLIAQIRQCEEQLKIGSPIELSGIDDDGLEFRLGMLQRRCQPDAVCESDIVCAMAQYSAEPAGSLARSR